MAFEEQLPTGPTAVPQEQMSVPPAEIPSGDPTAMPQEIGMEPQGTPTTPEDQAMFQMETKDLQDKIREKDNKFKIDQEEGSAKIEMLKADLVKGLFEALQKAGVDPSDLNSINQFLQELERSDPDLLTLFETVFNVLAPEQVPGMQGGKGKMPTLEEITGGSPGGMFPSSEGEMLPPETGTTPPVPQEEGGGLMDQQTSNLQEGMLRQ